MPPDTPDPVLTSQSSPRKLKILMIHGYTQSGHLFEIKTKALKKSLEKAFPPAPKPGHLKAYPGGISLHYPTGPIHLDPSDIIGGNVDGHKDASEAYGWWRRRIVGNSQTYDGMEIGLAALAAILQSEEGPFDAAMGFSQGGAATGLVASLLEIGRREAFERAQGRGGMPFPHAFIPTNDNHDKDTVTESESDTNAVTDSEPVADGKTREAIHAPLKFAVSYSGYGTEADGAFRAFYEPKLVTPMCHFIGSVDTIVEEAHSLRLVDACENGRGTGNGVSRLIYHPGGHFLPSSQKQCTAALVAFIREALGEEIGNRTMEQKEEKAEDMDLPF